MKVSICECNWSRRTFWRLCESHHGDIKNIKEIQVCFQCSIIAWLRIIINLVSPGFNSSHDLCISPLSSWWLYRDPQQACGGLCQQQQCCLTHWTCPWKAGQILLISTNDPSNEICAGGSCFLNINKDIEILWWQLLLLTVVVFYVDLLPKVFPPLQTKIIMKWAL